MSQVFVLQNQDGYFLSKQKEWVDGRDAVVLYRCVHHDEALNQMVEVNAKDYTQRISIVECELNPKRHPLLDPDTLPAPITETSDAELEALNQESETASNNEASSAESLSLEANTDLELLDASPEDKP